MTVEEKRKAVSKYCESINCDFEAKDCKLAHKEWGFKVYGTECLDILMSNEKDLDKALELIGGNSDNVNHPAHYQGANECIDVMIAMFGVEAVKSFCRCNAYKYRFRSHAKNGDEDIKKAEWYETKLIELEG